MKKLKNDDSGATGKDSSFTGPDYKYQDFIKSTDEMGMSGAGNFGALGNDIAGMISYSQLLIEGGLRGMSTAGKGGVFVILASAFEVDQQNLGIISSPRVDKTPEVLSEKFNINGTSSPFYNSGILFQY